MKVIVVGAGEVGTYVADRLNRQHDKRISSDLIRRTVKCGHHRTTIIERTTTIENITSKRKNGTEDTLILNLKN